MLPPEASIDSDFSCSEDKFVCNSPDKHICRTEEIKCFSIDFECDPASGDFKCSAKGKTDFCEREQKECMGEEEVSHTHPKQIGQFIPTGLIVTIRTRSWKTRIA